MADETYHPLGFHPFPTGGGGSSNIFDDIQTNGYAVGDIAILESGDVYRWDGTQWVLISIGGGGGGSGISYNQGAFTDPNGNVTGNVGDVYKSRISLGGDGSVWWKETGTGTNTGWGA